MLTIEPTGAVLGATVRGIDLARPLREPDLGRILLALGKHGVLRFPDQHLDLGVLRGGHRCRQGARRLRSTPSLLPLPAADVRTGLASRT
jgi:alpha-ketoglutarate-dependent taurine dioxygenase